MDNSIYRDVYNLHAECLDRLNEPDFCDSVFWPKVNGLSEKHRGDTLYMDMIIAVFGDLERRWKDEQQSEGQRRGA